MSNIRGIGSDRTTFNEKQEVGALKIGILKKNQDLRNTVSAGRKAGILNTLRGL